MSKELTKRQSEILSFIKDFAIENGYPPTIPEIQKEFGIKSPNGVNNHIKALTRKGFIRRNSSRARALDIKGIRDGIPIIGRVAAGTPILAEENLEEHFTLNDIYRKDDDVYMLRVRGDSMINAGIFNDDLVLVRMQPAVEQGQIGVAIIDDEATVKRIFSDGNIVKLVPENDTMRPITVMQTDPNFRIGGRVIGVFRRM